MIEAAIFDMDGLLIDSERIIMQGCIAAAQEIGIAYTQAEYVQLIGRVWSDSTRIMTQQLGGEANFNHVVKSLNTYLDKLDHAFPLKAGALNLLQHYQASGIICSVASSSPMQHITHRLTRTGVLDYFSHLTSGQEVARGKPNPDIYLRAVDKLGLNASECIAFEDSELGAQAAIAAGLKVVVVPDLLKPSDFVKNNSHAVAESLQHWLDAL